MSLGLFQKKRFWLWGGSAVWPDNTKAIRLHRQWFEHALLHDMGSIPIRCQWELAVDVGLFQWGFGKARLAMVKLGLAAGNRTFVNDN